MCHKSQKGFCGIFVGILQNQKGYLVYVPSTQKLFSSHDIVFDETFLSEFTYMSRPYSEALTMWTAVSYFLYTTSYHEHTGNVIAFEHFEEVN